MLTWVKWTLSQSLTLLFQTSCIPMALLTRHLKLSDHDDTQIFTFVGTKSVTRDLSRDITSKDFRRDKTCIIRSWYCQHTTYYSYYRIWTQTILKLLCSLLCSLKEIHLDFVTFSFHFLYTFLILDVRRAREPVKSCKITLIYDSRKLSVHF